MPQLPQICPTSPPIHLIFFSFVRKRNRPKKKKIAKLEQNKTNTKKEKV